MTPARHILTWLGGRIMFVGSTKQSSSIYDRYQVELYPCRQHLLAYFTSIKPRLKKEGEKAFDDLLFMDEVEETLKFFDRIYGDFPLDKVKKDFFEEKVPIIMRYDFREEILRFLKKIKTIKNNNFIKKIDFLTYYAKRDSDEFKINCEFIHRRFSCFTLKKDRLLPDGLVEVYHQRATMIDALVHLHESRKKYNNK